MTATFNDNARIEQQRVALWIQTCWSWVMALLLQAPVADFGQVWHMPTAKELWAMRFQWDRPYRVNADKFTKRFAFTPTPFSESMVATAQSFAPK